MNVANMTVDETRERAIRALARELGPAGMVRFLQQSETGHGDYSVDRDQWLPDVQELPQRPGAASD